MKKQINKRSNEAITMISLIVTIIILLILAGVTIAMLTNSGIIDKANDAAKATKLAQTKEDLQVKILGKKTEVMAEKGREDLTVEELNDIISEFGTLQDDGDTIVTKDGNISLKEIMDGNVTLADSDTSEGGDKTESGNNSQEIAELKQQIEELKQQMEAKDSEYQSKITQLEGKETGLDNSIKQISNILVGSRQTFSLYNVGVVGSQYVCKYGKMVFCHICLQTNNNITYNTAIATIPAGYRPTTNIDMRVVDKENSAQRIDFSTSGAVTLQAGWIGNRTAQVDACWTTN